jgi:alpha-galactosidase
LMSYASRDQQPSVFLLNESAHQAMLTVFNWTEQSHTRAIKLSDLGLKTPGTYAFADAFRDQGCCAISSGTISFDQPPHSVRMIKVIDNSVPVTAPAIDVQSPSRGGAGETLTFKAAAASAQSPVLICHWEFGDGTSADGSNVHHAYTHAGDYEVTVTAMGLDSIANRKILDLSISGEISTRFEPASKRRAEQ